jgi:hypothetical protein
MLGFQAQLRRAFALMCSLIPAIKHSAATFCAFQTPGHLNRTKAHPHLL